MATKFWPPEGRTYVDRRGGRMVRQLTAHKAHSYALHPAAGGWWDQGRKVLFASDRLGKTNLYSVDLQSGGITQHTDGDMPAETPFLLASVNPARPEVYFWRGNQLIIADLVKNAERVLYRADANFSVGMTSVTADGRFVCTAIYQNIGDRVPLDLMVSGAGSREVWEARPESRVLAIPLDGGPAREVVRERNWIGHVMASPTQPNILAYRHEGPPDAVAQRIWGLDLRIGKPWAIRPQRPGEQILQCWWNADGIHLGYHGRRAGDEAFLGRTRYDVGQPLETPMPGLSGHAHSLGPELVVADGGAPHPARVVRIWRWNGVSYDGPRVVCEHRGSFQVKVLGVRPRFSADARKVLFTSDRTGYAQVHEVEIGSFDTLPALV